MLVEPKSPHHKPIDWRVRMRMIPHGDTDWPGWLKWLLLTPALLLAGFVVFGVGGPILGLHFGVGPREHDYGVTWFSLGGCLNLSIELIGGIRFGRSGVSHTQIRIGFILFTIFAWRFVGAMVPMIITWKF